MGGNAATKYSGRPETFQGDAVGTFTYSSFPAGWYDAAQVSPDSAAPEPSAVVIRTTDAFGHTTKALATFPAVADSQGIYRPIEQSNFYKTQVDVRVDQFSDTDPSVNVPDPNNPGFLLCGCPVGTENIADWPMQVTFGNIDGVSDPSLAPAVGLIASAQTYTWHLFAGTQNVIADVDLGIYVQEGTWYGLETDFDVASGTLHGVVTDVASGAVLSDQMVFLYDPAYGSYDPNVDGVFNSELYVDGEHTLIHSTDPSLTRPGLAVIDNIDSSNQAKAWAYGRGDDHGGHARLSDSVLFDLG